jgi:CRP-like cAMP-binding protein
MTGITSTAATRACDPLSGALSRMTPFRNVPVHWVAEAEKSCRAHRFRRDQVLLTSGDVGDHVYFVLNGTVRCLYHSAAGRIVALAEVHAGEMFGELAAIDGLPRAVDVVALVETTVVVMPAATFRGMLRHEQVAQGILQDMSRRMRALTDRMVELSTLEVGARVRSELLRIANQHPLRGSTVTFPAPRHADLACRISANREAVTREMVKLTRAGLLEKQHRNLVIRDVIDFRQSLAGLIPHLSRTSLEHIQ